VKEFHWIAVAAVVAAAMVIGLWQIGAGQARFSNGAVFLLIGIVAAIAVIAIFIIGSRTSARNGRSSGDERGPEPGDGAVIHHSSGETDFDGLPGDVPPPIKDADRDL
jgi:hypothetical protein